MDDKQKKRPTVCVTCSVPNGVQIALHKVHEGTLGVKSQVKTGDTITLQQGDNPGIDKEWFDLWLEENAQLSLVTGKQITARDEELQDEEPEAPRGPVYALPQSQPGSIEEMRQLGDRPFDEKTE